MVTLLLVLTSSWPMMMRKVMPVITLSSFMSSTLSAVPGIRGFVSTILLFSLLTSVKVSRTALMLSQFVTPLTVTVSSRTLVEFEIGFCSTSTVASGCVYALVGSMT